MKKRRKNNKIVLILILILGISIGYAALASNLKINGGSKVTKATWLIHWANPQVVPGSVTDTKPVLSENNTNATYSVTLNEPGDFYEFTIDAVNEGSIDAEILNIKSKYNGPTGTDITEANLPAYLEYEVTYADENHTAISAGDGLDHGQTRTYRVRVAYSQNINPGDLHNEDITTTFYFEVEYKQKDKPNGNEENNTTNNDVIKITDRQVPGEFTEGDTVTIGEGDTTQPFIVVKEDGDNVVLLAKYNISAYATTKGSTQFYQYDGTPYIQEDCDQWCEPHINPNYDYVPFSKTNYWNGNLANYTNNYVYNSSLTSTPIYDEGYECVFDSSSFYNCLYGSEYGNATHPSFLLEPETPDTYSIAYYVNQYKNVLEGMGATIQEARILSLSEATPLVSGSLLKYSGSTGFWLGTAQDNERVYYLDVIGSVSGYDPQIESDKVRTYFSDEDSYSYSYHGVRPAIVVRKSDIKDAN